MKPKSCCRYSKHVYMYSHYIHFCAQSCGRRADEKRWTLYRVHEDRWPETVADQQPPCVARYDCYTVLASSQLPSCLLLKIVTHCSTYLADLSCTRLQYTHQKGVKATNSAWRKPFAGWLTCSRSTIHVGENITDRRCRQRILSLLLHAL